jgi:hypothetical protein
MELIRSTVLLPVLLFWGLPALGQPQFDYERENDAIIVNKYIGSEGEVIVPSRINGLPVTVIADQAFGYSHATHVRIPDSVTKIGGSAFWSCDTLIAITVDPRNKAYTSVAGVLFDRDLTRLVKYPPRKSGKAYTIPDGVIRIGGWAFHNCAKLASVTIPNSVTSIEIGAFAGCGLTNVTIPDNVASIDGSAFMNCSSLVMITVDRDNEKYSSVDGVLFDRWKTKLIHYPAKNGNHYTVPGSVVSIPDYLFSSSYLSSVAIEDGVSSIGNHAFHLCYSLTNARIADSVTSIGDQAFEGCNRLREVTIPNRLTSIRLRAFAGCNLGSITIPSTVTRIGDHAFEACTALASVTISNGVASIGNYAFCQCYSLTNVTIPNSVTAIGDCAFWNCRNLASATIGSGVTKIGYRAFAECASLRGIYFLGTAPHLGSNAFDGDNGTTVYYLPSAQGWGASFGGRPTEASRAGVGPHD